MSDQDEGRAPPDRRGGRRVEREVREGKERTWRFLRALVGLLLVAWLVPALFAPLDPFVFLLLLVPAWTAMVPVAWWLGYRDGYAWLRDHGYYDPGLPAGKALSIFAALTVVLKAGATVAADAVVGSRPFPADVAVSVVVLALAYVAVYRGLVARLAGVHGAHRVEGEDA